jgi:hypothetical protein
VNGSIVATLTQHVWKSNGKLAGRLANDSLYIKPNAEQLKWVLGVWGSWSPHLGTNCTSHQYKGSTRAGNAPRSEQQQGTHVIDHSRILTEADLWQNTRVAGCPHWISHFIAIASVYVILSPFSLA